MVELPLFEKLDVEAYGLFPKGLHISFAPGLSLILGSNGLGKTTIINILYRLLTGPWDISALGGGGMLGSTQLNLTTISRYQREFFAKRVADGAQNSIARLQLVLGEKRIVIKRSLKTLNLISLELDGGPLISDELIFQEKMNQLVGVDSFSDWILILRFLVFYFEDRRALLWDPTAQRQILRALLLSNFESAQWSALEKKILQLDTEMRNTRAVYSRYNDQVKKAMSSLGNLQGLQEELSVLNELQNQDKQTKERIEGKLNDLDTLRQECRRSFLVNQDNYEALVREAENAKMLVLREYFPRYAETARYILSHLIATQECLVCGNTDIDMIDYQKRITEKKCIVCESPVLDSQHAKKESIAELRVDKKQIELHEMKLFLDAEQEKYEQSVDEFNVSFRELQSLRQAMKERELKINAILSKLPPDSKQVEQQKSSVEVLKDKVEELESQLKEKRQQFKGMLQKANKHIVNSAEEIVERFNSYAQEFLFEKCTLSWAPLEGQLGQGGERMHFPAFALEMTGTDFPVTVRRNGPEDVSESQKEFIDLSFRKALMETLDSHHTSMIIDAPESSLDAIFVRRAASTLCRFGKPEKTSRLIITSNLIDGDLIPYLLKDVPTEDRIKAMINLFNIAVPTAAVREYEEDYKSHFEKLLNSKTA